MAKLKAGSGVTTTGIISELRKLQSERYIEELKKFGARAPSKKALADMEAGFKDGMTTMLYALKDMGVITVLADGDEIES